MPTTKLDAETLLEALAALGDSVAWSSPIEITVVGGGAAILTGLLPYRLTTDCDVALHVPKEAWSAVTNAAQRIAGDLGLSPDWLNAEVQANVHRLPEGWRGRATTIGRFGVVSVLAIGRLDFIAMKTIAGRAQDLMDLRELDIDREELAFVRGYLADLAERHPHREREHVREAIALLEELT